MKPSSTFLRYLLFFVLGAAVAGGIAMFAGGALSDSSDAGVPGSDEAQLYTCGMHPQVIQEGPGDCPICGMKLTPMASKRSPGSKATSRNEPCTEERALYWRAPMDATYVRDEPGKSPMGMDLVPVCDEDDPGVVQVESSIRQAMGITTAVAKRSDLAHTVRTVARVEANERREVVVTSKFSGWVEKLYVNETGQFVRRGQALFTVYSPEVVAGLQEYLLAARRGDDVLTQTSRDRLSFWDISEREIKALEARGKPSKTVTIYSPATGYVVDKNLIEGAKIKPEARLFRIADLSRVWVQAEVYEYELPWIAVGQEAELTLSYVPGKVFKGKVTFVYPTVDERSRTVKVRLEFENHDLVMRPGMFGTVRIQTKLRENVLQVPNAAVLRTGRRNMIFIAAGEGAFKGVEIVLGEESADGRVEVLEGLHAGQRVVTNGHFLLDSESQLQEAVAKMRSRATSGGMDDAGPSSGPASGPASAPASEDHTGHDH